VECEVNMKLSCKNCKNTLICSVREQFINVYEDRKALWTLNNGNSSEAWDELFLYLAKYCVNHVDR